MHEAAFAAPSWTGQHLSGGSMQPKAIRQSIGGAGAPAAAGSAAAGSAAGFAVDDASAPRPPLLQLCPEQLVMKHLRQKCPGTYPEPCHRDQHALHSTCRAARQATSDLIDKLDICICPGDDGWEVAQQGARMLSRLPRSVVSPQWFRSRSLHSRLLTDR